MDITTHKQHQTSHHDNHFDAVTMASVPFQGLTRVGQFIAERPIRTGLALLGADLRGASVLCVCAGTGEEAVFLQIQGANVTASDISRGACDVIARRNSAVHTVVADAEQLPFADASFDYVVVKHGLHHLPRPLIGLYEMWRVARRGIIVLEAQDSWPIRLGTRLDVIAAVEESGNYVYRFTRREMKKIFATLFVPDVRVRTEWYQFVQPLEQYVYPWLNNAFGFTLFRGFFWFVNALFGRWGNNFIMVVRKPQP